MKISRSIPFFIVFLGIAWISCNRVTPAQTDNHLGEVHFTPEGNTDALPHFHQGLLLLHSFEYDDARKAFEEAQQRDPDMVMAYWGEAMVHNHPLWRQQDTEAARKVLAKLAPTAEQRAAKVKSKLEGDLLQAVEILYGEGEKVVRDSAYSAHMQTLHKKYPEQHEVAAFYALSLLGAVPVGRDEAAYELGAQVAKSILEENPSHPGALHYLIHAYDDPNHAALAIQAADNYSQVAPDATHALHMPSHIYVAMGMWDEVVSSNIASYNASVKRMEELGLDHDGRSYHAFAWLLYGQLQKGRLAEAKKIMTDMITYTEELPSKSARSYLVMMKGNYLVETGDWEGPFADIPIKTDDLNIVDQAVFSFLEGIKAFKAKEEKKLENIIRDLEEKRQSASLQVGERGTPVCSAVNLRDLPNQSDLDKARVMELELRGLYAQLIEKPDMAEKWLAEASLLERNIDYSFGPPDIPYPSFELFGRWLLDQGRAEEAMEQYHYALARGPRRVKALKGKLSAAEQLNDEKIVSETRAILDQIAGNPSEI